MNNSSLLAIQSNDSDVCAEERILAAQALEEKNALENKKRAADTVAERLLYLNEIGLALSSEHDIERLLDLILTRVREQTDADAGSLYIVEKTVNEHGIIEQNLYFRHAQNDSVPVEPGNFAVSKNTLAGYAALTGETINCDDAYEIEAGAPYGFSDAWDKKNAYRTKSVLVVPMKNRDNEVIGVLQLINRKRNDHAKLLSPEDFDREVIPFDKETSDFAAVLASQAAVALQNNMLLQEVTKLLGDIEKTLESFVRATATLIDDRDKATSGHSQRVTIMTVAMAEVASEAKDGPFKDVYFSPKQLQELRYAGLLHDTGKIGVRDYIFTKSHKLEPLHAEAALNRLELLRRSRHIEFMQQKFELAQTSNSEARIAQLEAEMQQEFALIDADAKVLKRANDPTVTYLPDDEFNVQQEVIVRLAQMSYYDREGVEKPILLPEEVSALGVRRGSLTADERKQMEAHAAMSFEFLRQITWTEDLKNIPDIAHCHHEKLNGKGYPRGITGDQIGMQARMMTVADIYDALTAADRPYKKAMPIERALSILREEAARGDLDSDVVDLFISNEIYKWSERLHSTSNV